MGTKRVIPRECATKCGRPPARGSLFCMECSAAADTAARTVAAQLPTKPAEQRELVPSAAEPTPATSKAVRSETDGGKLLAAMSSADSEGWVRGFVDGALWLLDDKPAPRVALAELERRFGGARISERMRLHPDLAAWAKAVTDA